MTKEEFLIELMQVIGKPYIFGGSGPQFFDCSGLVQFALFKLKIGPPYDMTAHGLYNYYRNYSYELLLDKRDLGDLCFYGEANKITHCAICLNDDFIIEARGGDETTNSIEEAKKRGAQVSVSPLNSRKDLFTILRPNNLPWLIYSHQATP